MTEAYRIAVHTLADPAACGYEPCRSQPWVNEACPLSGDGSDIACATESGGPGAFRIDVDALPEPAPDMSRYDIAAWAWLIVLTVVVLVVVIGGRR